MTQYGTIKIPRDEYERHNEKREQLGLSWAEYIDKQAPEVPNHAEGVSNDAEDIAEVVRNELGSIGTSASGDNSEVLEEIEKLKRIVDNLPERTAEKFGDRYR